MDEVTQLQELLDGMALWVDREGDGVPGQSWSAACAPTAPNSDAQTVAPYESRSVPTRGGCAPFEFQPNGGRRLNSRMAALLLRH